MKIGSWAALALVIPLVFGGSSAQADCASGAISLSNCLQCCLKEYNQAVKDCGESCTFCTEHVIFGLFCWKKQLSQTCLQPCLTVAQGALNACTGGCHQKFPPPPVIEKPGDLPPLPKVPPGGLSILDGE